MHLSNKITICRFLYKGPISTHAKFYGEFYKTGKYFHLNDNFNFPPPPCAFSHLSKMLYLLMLKSLKTQVEVHSTWAQLSPSGTSIAYRSYLHEFWVPSPCNVNGECSVSLAGSTTVTRTSGDYSPWQNKTALVTCRD